MTNKIHQGDLCLNTINSILTQLNVLHTQLTNSIENPLLEQGTKRFFELKVLDKVDSIEVELIKIQKITESHI